MNETHKTLTFFAIAAVACAAAYWAQPTTADFDVETLEGTELTEPFDDEKAKRMKIVRFDEDSATLTEFEVAEENGVWSIPSKGGYPADAERQMAEATTGVMDREILNVVSNNAGDHEQFGVIDPTSPKLTAGQTGVGKRVTLYDEKDDPLVDIVIGKPVKNSENQHYVRNANYDAVYVVEINPEDFSTTFEDWIEDDLLKLSTLDIKKVRLNDYSAEMFNAGGSIGVDLNRRADMTLSYDDSESEWTPVVLKQAADERGRTMEEFTLSENQALDDAKLNQLKNALDDLRIVDVNKKPAGLSANLKAGESFMNDLEAQLSLIQRGFAPTRTETGEVEILSSEGEVIASMKDGVEYVLRFGNLQLSASEETPSATAAGEGAADDQEAVNRYMFVMARFNEDLIERPELEEVPELPEDVTQEQVEAVTGEDSEEGEEGDTEEETSDAEADDPIEDTTEEPADEQGAAADQGTSAEEDEPQTELEKLVAERKEIEQRNQRKLDEYTTKIKEGREHVEELNGRFGDWYYVIANDVFKKIHLSKDDVIKQAEAEAGADARADGAAASEQNPLGGPGAEIPGMPDLSGLDVSSERTADEPPVESPGATTPEQPAPQEGPAEATADEASAAEASSSEEATSETPTGEENSVGASEAPEENGDEPSSEADDS